MGEDIVTPRFSVVIPVHNKGLLLAEALASVTSQTLRDFEVLVVDDASTDDGPSMLASFPGLHLRLLRRSVPGPAGYAARNFGIREARGKWIAFLDADDLWFSDHLAHAARWIDRFPEAVVYCSGHQEIFGRSVRTIAVSQTRCLEARSFLGLYAREDLFHTNSMVIRRQVLLDCGGFPEDGTRRGGDHALWFRTVLYGAPVILASEVTSQYRRDHSAVVSNPSAMMGRHPVCTVAGDALAGRLALPEDWGEVEQRLIRQLANRKALHWLLQSKRMGANLAEVPMLPYPSVMTRKDQFRWFAFRYVPQPLLRLLFVLKHWSGLLFLFD